MKGEMGDKREDKAIILMGVLKAEGIIEPVILQDSEYWRLTDKGKVEAEKAMRMLTRREQSLVLLLADSIIREGNKRVREW